MASVNSEVFLRALGALCLLSTVQLCAGLTDSRDVIAMNSLYVSLGYPPLQGWLLVGGDPCGELWQGVECAYSNITSLNLTNMDLGGMLSGTLDFPSILSIDLSNNHIGGSIPSNLPCTLLQLSLSNNSFGGDIPDAFQPLSTLIDLDLSFNNLTGPLPQSFGNLSALNILHLQNNKLTGLLDVVEDLPLTDLNVENNLFSGPVPAKLLGIPSFKKDGNPFNTSVLPSPPAPSPIAADEPTPSIPASPSPAVLPWKQAGGPLAGHSDSPSSGRSSGSKTVLVIAGLGAVALILVGGLWLCVRRCTRKDRAGKIPERHDESAKYSKSLPVSDTRAEKAGPRELVGSRRFQDTIDQQRMASGTKQDEYKLDTSRMGLGFAMNLPPTRARPPSLAPDMAIAHPPASGGSILRTPSAERVDPPNTAARYDIASLQLFTNSFSQENFIGEGTLGSVYKGRLPNGKLLAIKKLDTAATRRQDDKEFHGLVSRISMLRHQNIVELVGYCSEHGQKLLVYDFCQNGTLHDALHIDKHMHKKLSWEIRIRIALGAARALEYLHETCQPPVVHRNFKSMNVLFNDELEVRVSDSGLAPLFASSSKSSDLYLAANGYAAPELESGAYTWQSDVYSFGVVMLELLTGRRPYERARPRGTQYLARWAISRLHDIDALSKMVDPLLNGLYPAKSLSRFADIISRCIQGEPEFRPLMSEIVQDLLHVI